METRLTPRGLERRLKRHVLRDPHDFLAVCTPGFERVLGSEVAALPGSRVRGPIAGGVEFSGPLELIYHANLRLRTANRVLLRLDDFLAQSYPMLYDHARKTAWEHHLGFSGRLAVRVSAKKSRLRHQRKIAETIHSAVSRRLEPLGVDVVLDDAAPVEVLARLFEDRCTLSLNTSGEHLHRRGYRQSVTAAPLRETLAAGCLRHAGWERHDLILDPMCGSGTFLVEAAELATRRAPGRARAFALEHLPYFQPSKWARFKREAERATRPAGLRILGADLDPRGLAAARENAARAGVLEALELLPGDARLLPYDELCRGARRPLLVSNLPYGERLGSDQDVRALYGGVCARIARLRPGCNVAFVTTRPEWLRSAGLRVTSELGFVNGGLRVSLVQGTVG